MDYSDAFDSGSDLTAEDAEDNYDLDAYNPTGYESANLRGVPRTSFKATDSLELSSMGVYGDEKEFDATPPAAQNSTIRRVMGGVIVVGLVLAITAEAEISSYTVLYIPPMHISFCTTSLLSICFPLQMIFLFFYQKYTGTIVYPRGVIHEINEGIGPIFFDSMRDVKTDDPVLKRGLMKILRLATLVKLMILGLFFGFIALSSYETYNRALLNTPSASLVCIYNSCAVWSFILSVLFLGERPTFTKILATVFSLAGVILIGLGESSSDEDSIGMPIPSPSPFMYPLPTPSPSPLLFPNPSPSPYFFPSPSPSPLINISSEMDFFYGEDEPKLFLDFPGQYPEYYYVPCNGIVDTEPKSEEDMNYMVGDFFALLTAFMCAGYNVAWKKVVGDPSQVSLMALISAVGAMTFFCLWPLFFLFDYSCDHFGAGERITIPQNDDIAALMVCSSLAGLGIVFLQSVGIALTSPLFVVIASMLAIPLTSIIDRVIRHIPYTPMKIMGTIGVLIGFVIMNLEIDHKLPKFLQFGVEKKDEEEVEYARI